MCGIVGIVAARTDARPEHAIVEGMASRLPHAGSDDTGFVVRGPAALGVRRLRVIDPETGAQPMTGGAGTVWVALDGAIYNRRELARRLSAAGHQLRTRSDAETIAHAWEMRGSDALDDLEGVFGLAVWDETTRALVLARDRLGVKPLYYAVLDDGLVFASALDAVLQHPGVSRELDMQAVSAYLAHGWVPAPRTIVKDVRKLAPGHRLIYANGEARVERWWDVRYGDGPPPVDIQGAARLGAVLDLSVRQHLLSDVPLGVWLSGGIDSTVVALFARRHVSRLRTFAIGFDDASLDESRYARRAASVLDAEHHEEIIGAEAAGELVGKLGDLVDEPVGDASILPTYLLARFAGRSITVALSGHGADELFAGSAIYQRHRLARAPVIKRFIGAGDVDVDTRHALWTGSFAPDEQRGLLTPDALARLPEGPSYADWQGLAASAPTTPWLHRVLYLDLKGALAEGGLRVIDRAAMACSVQVRAPLLDRRVVEVAAALPPTMKLRGRATKHVLRWLVRKRLPRDVVRRPHRGIGVPLARWLRDGLSPLVREVCDEGALGRERLIRGEVVTRLVAEHARGDADQAKRLYTLLVLVLWMRRHRVS
jgi:asparagine synthase (glutamine-hydrolysing)